MVDEIFHENNHPANYWGTPMSGNHHISTETRQIPIFHGKPHAPPGRFAAGHHFDRHAWRVVGPQAEHRSGVRLRVTGRHFGSEPWKMALVGVEMGITSWYPPQLCERWGP